MNLSLLLCAVLVLWIVPAVLAAEAAKTLDVWPGAAPGEKGDIGPEKWEAPPKNEIPPITRLTNVTKPTIAIYPPPKAKNTGTAVLICPGGGYSILAMNHEGEDVATWLNSIGVTGIVLRYRVPARKGQPRHLAPLQDAQRAMSLVRAQAKQLEINPDRIGILGFSAGANLAAIASTNFDQRQYEALDDTDKVSCRPDFAVLLYSAWLVDEKTKVLLPEVRVTPQTPPVFFAHAGDDKICAESSIQMHLALRQAKVPTELHVFEGGGHGFGMRPIPHPIAGWPGLCEQWLRTRKLIPNP
ncbi:MAG: alpha/beta hydrolase [Planctomycetota bacterium]|nr:alpha/beta hydrolase [Planctomycetota bacterium]